jgi:co-chaperonin GroES (HSP10)
LGFFIAFFLTCSVLGAGVSVASTSGTTVVFSGGLPGNGTDRAEAGSAGACAVELVFALLAASSVNWPNADKGGSDFFCGVDRVATTCAAVNVRRATEVSDEGWATNEKTTPAPAIAPTTVAARDEAGKLIPIDLKTGDRVLFGKWSATEVKIDGVEYLIM